MKKTPRRNNTMTKMQRMNLARLQTRPEERKASRDGQFELSFCSRNKRMHDSRLQDSMRSVEISSLQLQFPTRTSNPADIYVSQPSAGIDEDSIDNDKFTSRHRPDGNDVGDGLARLRSKTTDKLSGRAGGRPNGGNRHQRDNVDHLRKGLHSFKKLYPDHRTKEIEACIGKAVNFIESLQRNDGSWSVINSLFP
ncbi:hypothetical protein Scep_024528 [Stephania cephalantha]|uniref:Uncharacterized protein n=1 Tax=Stephania cephalantha TaxID=152367 RepID=A0AAP0HTS1_9MAGN